MTQEKNLTKEILSKRQDEREVTSRVLKSLPESVNLKQQSDCHVCPNAVWFTESMDSQDPTLSVYCQIFRSVIWQSNYRKENIPVRDVRRDYDRQFTESGIKSLERSSFCVKRCFRL